MSRRHKEQLRRWIALQERFGCDQGRDGAARAVGTLPCEYLDPTHMVNQIRPGSVCLSRETRRRAGPDCRPDSDQISATTNQCRPKRHAAETAPSEGCRDKFLCRGHPSKHLASICWAKVWLLSLSPCSTPGAYGDGTSLGPQTVAGGPLPQDRWGEKTSDESRVHPDRRLPGGFDDAFQGTYSVNGGPPLPIPAKGNSARRRRPSVSGGRSPGTTQTRACRIPKGKAAPGSPRRLPSPWLGSQFPVHPFHPGIHELATRVVRPQLRSHGNRSRRIEGPHVARAPLQHQPGITA